MNFELFLIRLQYVYNAYMLFFYQGKQMQEQFTFALGVRMESTPSLYSELEAEFRGAFTVAYEHVMHVLQKLTSVCDGRDLSKESQQNITSWKTLFKAYATDLNIGPLCDITFRAICLAVCEHCISSL